MPALPSSRAAATAVEPAPPAVDARRRAILEAARHVCLTHGVASARMEEIAAEASVSKGTLYNHFESKDQLLLEMVVSQFRDGDQVVHGVMGEPATPVEALRRLIDGLAQMLQVQTRHTPLLFQVWAVVAHEVSLRDALDAALREMFAGWAARTRETIEAGQAEGSFRPDVDAAGIGNAITCLVSGFLFRATFDPDAANGPALRAALHALVTEQLLPLDALTGDPR